LRFSRKCAYYACGNPDGAIREPEAALAISPGLDQTRYYVGVLYAQRGDKANARKELEQVMNGSAQMMLKNQTKIRIGLPELQESYSGIDNPACFFSNLPGFRHRRT
jgi:hypothetical protein